MERFELIQNYDYVKFDLAVNYQTEESILPINLLCTAPLYQITDSIEIFEYIKAWALTLKLVNTDSKVLQPALVQGCANAFREATSSDLKIYSKFALLILLLDDVLDEAWQVLGGKENITRTLHIFLDALAGKNANISAINIETKFPKIHAIHSAFADIHAELSDRKLNAQYFLSSMKKFSSYLLKEFNYRQSYNQLTLDAYLAIRAIVGGLDPSCEIVYLLQNIELTPTIRSNPKFLLLKEQAYKALIVANDILSLAKEIHQGNTSNNYILIKHSTTHIPLLNIIQEFQHLYNTMILKIASIKLELLDSISAKDQHDVAAVRIIEEQIQAHLDWGLQTARYHSTQLAVARSNISSLTLNEIKKLFC